MKQEPQKDMREQQIYSLIDALVALALFRECAGSFSIKSGFRKKWPDG